MVRCDLLHGHLQFGAIEWSQREWIPAGFRIARDNPVVVPALVPCLAVNQLLHPSRCPVSTEIERRHDRQTDNHSGPLHSTGQRHKFIWTSHQVSGSITRLIAPGNADFGISCGTELVEFEKRAIRKAGVAGVEPIIPRKTNPHPLSSSACGHSSFGRDSIPESSPPPGDCPTPGFLLLPATARP